MDKTSWCFIKNAGPGTFILRPDISLEHSWLGRASTPPSLGAEGKESADPKPPGSASLVACAELQLPGLGPSWHPGPWPRSLLKLRRSLPAASEYLGCPRPTPQQPGSPGHRLGGLKANPGCKPQAPQGNASICGRLVQKAASSGTSAALEISRRVQTPQRALSVWAEACRLPSL